MKLRENHSGMETEYRLLLDQSGLSCVRTIVVWKPSGKAAGKTNFPLRENHSGMETSYIYNAVSDYPLRENHSGMETQQ